MSTISRMTSAAPRVACGHRQVAGDRGAARGTGRFTIRHGVVEPFPDAVERNAGIAAAVGRHRRDGLLELVELRAPVSQLPLHGIDARGGIDARESFAELTFEALGLSEVVE